MWGFLHSCWQTQHILTVDMALTMPLVIWSCRMCLTTSNWAALCFGIIWSAIFFNSELNFLKRSSKSRDKSWERERAAEEDREGSVHQKSPPITNIKLSFPSDFASHDCPSGDVMPVCISNQRSAVITIRFNNQVCQLADKPDLASVPGPLLPSPVMQEVTSLITPPHTLTYIKNKQAALFRINKEIKLSLCSQAN